MTEAAPYAPEPDPARTGVPEVDALQGRPVAEHVGVFEAVHDRLRSLLAGESQHSGPGH